MRNIRVQSDGSGNSTVVTTEDGTQLHPAEATIWLNAGEYNRVELTFVAPGIDIHAELSETTMACPICSHSATHYCPSELRSP